MSRVRLGIGDRLPSLSSPPPGPRSIELAARLQRFEAPGVNTLIGGEPSIVWDRAVGANVADVDGNIYVDLTAGFGVAAVGHRNPEVLAAVRRQSERLVHGLADVAAHPARIELAERLARVVPVDEAQIYFAASGGDAVEVALATAWLATGKQTTVVFEPAYHGTTLGALAATSRAAFREPFLAQLNPHIVRLPYGGDPDDLAALLAARDDVAAVLIEPLSGREGAPPPAAGWLRSIADRSREHGALFIADEIFTGFGRTGSWFACEAAGVRPDLLCCGKALGGGMPIAAVAASAETFACWDRGGEALHTATFIAHPLACEAALTVLDLLERDDLPGRALRLGAAFEQRSERWQDEALLRSTHGRGLFRVLQMASRDAASRFVREALDRGLLLLAGGSRVQIVPPLTISERQWSYCLDTIEEILEANSPAE